MNTLVQHIETYWTKNSRGNPGASIRNAVSDSFPIEDVPKVEGVFLNEVKYSEYRNFRAPVVSDIRSINENQQRQLGFKFEVQDDGLLVSKWSHDGRLKDVGFLQPNTWLRLVTNERTSLEDTWAYYKHVYNICFSNVSDINNLMSSQAPITILNCENHLW